MTPDTPSLPDSIRELHAALGIPPSYPEACGMAFVPECGRLVAAGRDVFEREVLLDDRALDAWQAMQAAAASSGVDLQMVSGYRSVAYQAGIFQRKLAAGQAITDILRVNAAPGFSEHHGGCAIDVGTPGVDPLTEAFETTRAFSWLQAHAGDHGFSLSFPRDNPYNILYEPWHWKFTATS